MTVFYLTTRPLPGPSYTTAVDVALAVATLPCAEPVANGTMLRVQRAFCWLNHPSCGPVRGSDPHGYRRSGKSGTAGSLGGKPDRPLGQAEPVPCRVVTRPWTSRRARPLLAVLTLVESTAEVSRGAGAHARGEHRGSFPRSRCSPSPSRVCRAVPCRSTRRTGPRAMPDRSVCRTGPDRSACRARPDPSATCELRQRGPLGWPRLLRVAAWPVAILANDSRPMYVAGRNRRGWPGGSGRP
jgi:hypothetical protein